MSVMPVDSSNFPDLFSAAKESKSHLLGRNDVAILMALSLRGSFSIKKV